MPCTRSAAVAAAVAACCSALLAGCGGSDTGYDFDAICRTAEAPASTPAELNAIRDAITKAAPKTPGDKAEDDDLARLKAGITLGTEAGNAAAPYSIPSRLQPTDLPKAPDTTAVVAAQKSLKEACD